MGTWKQRWKINNQCEGEGKLFRAQRAASYPECCFPLPQGQAPPAGKVDARSRGLCEGRPTPTGTDTPLSAPQSVGCLLGILLKCQLSHTLAPRFLRVNSSSRRDLLPDSRCQSRQEPQCSPSASPSSYGWKIEAQRGVTYLRSHSKVGQSQKATVPHPLGTQEMTRFGVGARRHAFYMLIQMAASFLFIGVCSPASQLRSWGPAEKRLWPLTRQSVSSFGGPPISWLLSPGIHMAGPGPRGGVRVLTLLQLLSCSRWKWGDLGMVGEGGQWR